MKFEFTKDHDLINSCLKADHVWRMSTDDAIARMNKKLIFIKIDKFMWVKAGDYGVFMVENIDNDTCRVHVALKRDAIGKAVDISRHAIRWLLDNTSYVNVEALIPSFNGLTLRLAKESGMQFVHSLNKSFVKHGKMYDQHLFRINRGMICHQQ